MGQLLELMPARYAALTRRISLSQPVVAVLAQHLDTFTEDDEDALVFTNTAGGPVRRRYFGRAAKWSEVRQALGVPDLHVHDQRHTGHVDTRPHGADGP